MTKERISECGVPLNQWTTLEGAFAIIGLIGSSNQEVFPKTSQFYFDGDGNILFIRHTDGKPRLYKNETLAEREVIVPHDGKNYVMNVIPGGAKDSTVGYFHDAITFDNICGFFNY